MPRRLRIPLIVLGLAVVMLVAVGTVAVVPRWPAVQCLLGFQASVPDDVEPGGAPPEGFQLLEDEARYGVARAWLHRQGDTRAPTLLFVHGVAPKGIADGRILLAIQAFGRAGFTVIAPELPTLVDPLAQEPVGAGVARCLEAIARGAYEGAHPSRIGVVGISVGGALALRGCATYRREGGGGLRTVLLIGAPDDTRRTAKAWFAAENAAPVSDGSLAWERAQAAEFARSYIIRAGLIPAHGDDDDVRALDAWLNTTALPTDPPPALKRPELAALTMLVLAEPAVRSAAREDLLRKAHTRIEGLSPALWDAELAHLHGVAVFLLHGHGDPLVPIDEAHHLARRLRRHTIVSLLESHMVGHTSVNDVDLAERVAHVVQMDDFFDMIGR